MLVVDIMGQLIGSLLNKRFAKVNLISGNIDSY